ncbi:SH3 domain-containing protein [Novosphingobium colocasiae]|nr:SH3 domain-containing protein [Novosphingobium colocasiae]
MMKRPLLSAIALASLVICAPARADEDDKVPYWATIDTDLANLRVGPGDSYRIDWVYRRLHLPVKVVRREGPWRLIEDPDGTQGWMRDLLLSRQRGGIVKGKELVAMRVKPDDSAPIAWRIEPGVVGVMPEDCKQSWCLFDVNGHKGFVHETQLWGTGAP